MHSKKAIEISLTTLIGLAIAAVVLIFVVIPLISKAYGLLIKRPDYVTMQSFDRIAYQLRNLGEGETAIVPVQIGSDFKITTNGEDPACVKNCMCLCRKDISPEKKGCLLKIESMECYKEDLGSFKVSEEKISSVQISKTSSGLSFSGEITGNCDWRTDFNDCFANQCRYENNKCTSCLADTICGQYSRTPQTPNPAGFITPANIYDVVYLSGAQPEGGSSYFYSMKQCVETDPCKLREKGINCFWDVRNEIIGVQKVYFGSCKDCSNIQCEDYDEYPDFCKSACNGACIYNEADKECKPKQP